jgi:hypothetical protein
MQTPNNRKDDPRPEAPNASSVRTLLRLADQARTEPRAVARSLYRGGMIRLPGLLLVVLGAALVIVPTFVRTIAGLLLVGLGVWVCIVLRRVSSVIDRCSAFLRQFEHEVRIQGVSLRSVDQPRRTGAAHDKKETIH